MTNTETTILTAISNTVRVEFTYDGKSRVVEPHVIGFSKDNRAFVRGYQVDGGTTSGQPLPSWRLFEVEKISNISLTDRKFTTRLIEGYNAKDSFIVNNAVAL